MLRKLILVACILATGLLLFSVDLDWGVKYAAGWSSIHGKDVNYKLQYDVTNYVTDPSNNVIAYDEGYMKVKSNQQKYGMSQAAGLFVTFPVAKGVHTLLFQPEINWQRYTYSYQFNHRIPDTNSFLLQAVYPYHVDGHIDATMDYINVPLLFKMQKDDPEDTKENQAITSMFGYIGPSVSYLINSKVSYQGDLKTLDSSIRNFTQNSLTDADTLGYFTYAKLPFGVDKISKLKYDIVFGFGWNLKNVLKLNCQKDEWVIDTRFNLNINKLGDVADGDNFKLYNILLTIGYKL